MPAHRESTGWSRRSFLGMTSLATLLGVTGCRVRLEDDAPRIPLLTRAPMADETLLGAVLKQTWALQDQATGLGAATTGMPARIARLHAAQATVLSGLLTSGGAPLPVRPTATTPPASATAHPATAHAVAAASAAAGRRLGDAEQAAATAALTTLPTVSTTHLALLLSMTAQRLAAASLLGRPSGTAVVVTAPRGAAAVPLLAQARAAVYGFDVVTAHAGSRQKEPAADLLAAMQLRAATLQHLAGAAAGPPALGYLLPYPVNDASSAARLARHLLAVSSQGLAAEARSLAKDGPALATLAGWMAADEVAATRWGSAPSAFPGLVSA